MRRVLPVVLGLSWLEGAALACSCVSEPLETSYASTTDALIVQVLSVEVIGALQYMQVEVQQVFNGCALVGEIVVLRGSADDDCRLDLPVGSEHLVLVDDLGEQFEGLAVKLGSLCTFHRDAAVLGPRVVDVLEDQVGVCGEPPVCADGSEPAVCDPDSCANNPCGGLACETNACAACAREYFDEAGPAPDGDLDGAPDACDVCAGEDEAGDADADGVCDDQDVCLGFDAAGDADGDGWCADGAPGVADCADDDALTHPGAAEPCGGLDRNCDGAAAAECARAPETVSGGCGCEAAGGAPWVGLVGLLGLVVGRRRSVAGER